MSLKICIPAIAAFLLAACGGDGNKAGDPDPSAEADFVVDTFGDLSVCTDKREGATAYVKDEDHDYICTDGDWTIDTNADTRKKSSSGKDKAKSSSSRCEDCKDGAKSDSGKNNVKSSSSRCEDCKDDAKSSNSKDKAKSSSSRHCEDCKDEAISSSSVGGEKSSSSLKSFDWSIPKEDYLNPKISYGTLTDSRDGQTYKTVELGDQVWMAENLNYYDKTLDGRSWCYDATNSKPTENCSVAGRLYTWTAAVSTFGCGEDQNCTLPLRVNGICPPGWHLPNTKEWNTLFDEVGGQNIAGEMLKSQTGWDDYDGTSGNGTDDYGFSAIPAGFGLSDGAVNAGSEAYYWSTVEVSCLSPVDCSLNYGIKAYCVNLNYDRPGASLRDCRKRIGYSVRCLQDKSYPPLVTPCKTETEDNCEYGELNDDRDGQTYKTVKIGDQWWMAENLNYEVDSSFCYSDSVKYCEKFGRLYKWTAAVGVCPEGWHLPDTTEWNKLVITVGGKGNAGNLFKSQTGWDDYDGTSGNGTDAYGFSALPAGFKEYYDNFVFFLEKGNFAYFWSATEYNSFAAYEMDLNNYGEFVVLYHSNKSYAISVRCVQD